MKLEELRKKIDDMDEQIVKLIAERVKIAEDIGHAKRQQGKQVEDHEREKKVLEKVKNISISAGINEAEISKIYKEIMAVSKGMQGVRVAFQGEVGAYSEEAAYQFFGLGIELKPCESLDDVFKAVEGGDVKLGIVPVENSLEGSISRTYDLLLDSIVKVCGETQIRVVHNLIGVPEARLDLVKKVYSHPQALGQCKRFLKQLGFELKPTYDTAGSVKMVKEKGRPDEAAIASARASEIYGMKVLARGIEDNSNNFTRFFIISMEDSLPTGNDKTSIVFSLKHRPGALYCALSELAGRKINLTKIESRPTRQKAWEYNFYVDFDGHWEDRVFKEALEKLEESTIFIKVLGSYPKVR